MPLVEYRVDEHTAWVVLDDPDTRNALSDDLLDELIAALHAARDEVDVRVVVLASSHPTVFSSGGNLKGFGDDRAPIEKYRELNRFPELFKLMGALGKPVVCAVDGAALAGAFGLVLACDLVIAGERATFGCPEITVGVFPFMISALMFRSLGRQQANQLLFLGRSIDAQRAYALGIVNEVVADGELEAAARRCADRLAGFSPLLLRLGKDALDVARDLPLASALDVMQAQLALAFTTADLAEGVSAFRARRAPVWTMR